MSDYLTSCDDVSAISDDNRIKVVCRVRPPVMRETHGAKSLANRCVEVEKDRRTIVLNSRPQGKSFTFDYAAGEDSTQEEIFAEVGQPVTEACLEGYNGTIFCYGQTGSGKTFTTFGPGAVMENHLNPGDPKSYALRGLVPRVLEYLYDSIGRRVDNGGGKVSYACRCSFYEIFNEKVFDLVDESNRDNPMGLAVREDTRKGVYVEGLMEEEVDGADSACEVLYRGFRNRHVGETAMNRESSRSHAVFTLVIQAKEVVEEEGLTRSRVARFNLVDLAGSERQKDTQASGERLKEASNINKSLSTLGQVINALVEKSAGRFRHVHYRDSKLTFLLRDSLGGNSKTMLVAAVSPADQNFGETLSTLKFAQRAKMIKNQAIKNEDTSGSFDALRREVTNLRQQLAAKLQQEGGAAAGVSRAISSTSSDTCSEFALAGVGGDVDAGASSSDMLLADALRRARSAEAAQEGSRRRVETLLAAAERSEKDALQLKMVIKFRDGTIAAQRKKNADQERVNLAEENAHLRKQLEAGIGESSEVSKWRLQCKEAEARLVELMGDQTGDAKRLVWGVADEERFQGDLDEKVLKLMEENRQLKEEAETFEERLQREKRRVEKRRLSLENRAEFEAKKIVENALLSKLKGAEGRVEEKAIALASSEARVAELETERVQQGAAITALTKQLQDANRRVKEAVRDRDVRLGDLQSKIEQLSRAKERATEDSGSEVASLELKLATAIKDNSELLKANKALEEEADALDQDLDRLEADKLAQERAASAERERSAAAVASLNQRMVQQDEAHERETEELHAEKRSVMEDLDAVTERLRSAKEAHAREVKEQQRRTNDLQERLSETRTQKEQSEGRLRQLQDDYDTVSEQARFSQGRVEELEQDLERTAEDLLRARAHAEVVEDRLIETECRAEVEEFFKLAQKELTDQAQQVCADREQTIELLAEELEAAKAYASGVRILLATQQEEVIERGPWLVDNVELAHAVGGMRSAAAQAQENAVSTGLLSSMMEEHEGAVERIEELESIVDKLEEDRDQLEADSDLARRQYQAVSQVLEDLEAVHSCTRRDLASSQQVVVRLEEEIVAARSGTVNAEKRAEDLEDKLEKVRSSCFEFQARAVAAEGEVETLAADVARLVGEVEGGQAAAADEAWRAQEAAESAAAREEVLLAAVKVGKSEVAARTKEMSAKAEELAALNARADELLASEATVVRMAEEANIKRDELAASEAALTRMTEKARENAEKLGASEAALARVTEQASVKVDELAASEAALARKTEEARTKDENLAASEIALTRMTEEARENEERLTVSEVTLARVTEQASVKVDELAASEASLARKTEEARTKDENLAASETARTRMTDEARENAEKLTVSEAALARVTEQASVKVDELAASEAALARTTEEARENAEKLTVSEAALARVTEQASVKVDELAASEAALARTTEEARAKAENIAALEATLKSLLEEARQKAEMLAVSEAALVSVKERASAMANKLTATEDALVKTTEQVNARGDELLASEATLVRMAEEASEKRDELAASEAALTRMTEKARENAEKLGASVAALARVTEQASVKVNELAASEAALARKTEEARTKDKNLAASEAALKRLTEEVRQNAEKLTATQAIIAKLMEEAGVKDDELAALEAALTTMRKETSAKRDELAESQVNVATMAEEARAKTEKLSASEAAQANMVEEASEREEMLAEARQALEAEKMKLGALMSELDDAWGKESQVTEQLAVARSSADGLGISFCLDDEGLAAQKRH
ncbi:unnamed protein product [Ascophyllum nodosum]